MKKVKWLIILYVACCLWACNAALKPGELYGKWKYVKVEHPNANPPDSLSGAELQADAPSIEFSKDNRFVIIWGGKVLSHGVFTLDGMNIRMKEDLPDGTKRDFPFWVTSLTRDRIIFETKGDEKSKVTAVKENGV